MLFVADSILSRLHWVTGLPDEINHQFAGMSGAAPGLLAHGRAARCELTDGSGNKRDSIDSRDGDDK
jgi:hypothetical protein